MSGFYNLNNYEQNKLRFAFQFDKIYTSKEEMDAACATDDVYIGRYVLVQDENIPTQDARYDPETGSRIDWYGTVWQKSRLSNGEIKYVFIADLNSGTPGIDITVDPPLSPIDLIEYENQLPKRKNGLISFDQNADGSMYHLHIPSPWAFRVGIQDLEDEERKYSDIENNNNEKLTLYWNDDGFNYQKRPKNVPVEDIIKLLPATSGAVYWDKDAQNFIEKPDVYELIACLPSIGSSIADVWDIVYGENTELNDRGRWLPINNDEKDWANSDQPYRNYNLNWDDYNGIRLFSNRRKASLNNGLNKNATKTFAGSINTVHDLIGMIFRKIESLPENQDTKDWDPTKIYVCDNKFYRKKKVYSNDESETTFNDVTFVDYKAEEIYREDIGELPSDSNDLLSGNLYKNYIRIKSDDDVVDGGLYYRLSSQPTKETFLNITNYEQNKYYYKKNDNGITEYILDINEQPQGADGRYFNFTQEHGPVKVGVSFYVPPCYDTTPEEFVKSAAFYLVAKDGNDILFYKPIGIETATNSASKLKSYITNIYNATINSNTGQYEATYNDGEEEKLIKFEIYHHEFLNFIPSQDANGVKIPGAYSLELKTGALPIIDIKNNFLDFNPTLNNYYYKKEDGSNDYIAVAENFKNKTDAAGVSNRNFERNTNQEFYFINNEIENSSFINIGYYQGPYYYKNRLENWDWMKETAKNLPLDKIKTLNDQDGLYIIEDKLISFNENERIFIPNKYYDSNGTNILIDIPSGNPKEGKEHGGYSWGYEEISLDDQNSLLGLILKILRLIGDENDPDTLKGTIQTIRDLIPELRNAVGEIYSFNKVKVGDATVEATGQNDQLNLIAGDNIALTANTNNKEITISTLPNIMTLDGNIDLYSGGSTRYNLDEITDPGNYYIERDGYVQYGDNLPLNGQITAFSLKVGAVAFYGTEERPWLYQSLKVRDGTEYYRWRNNTEWQPWVQMNGFKNLSESQTNPLISLVTTVEKYNWNNPSLSISSSSEALPSGSQLLPNTLYSLAVGGSSFSFNTPVDSDEKVYQQLWSNFDGAESDTSYTSTIGRDHPILLSPWNGNGQHTMQVLKAPGKFSFNPLTNRMRIGDVYLKSYTAGDYNPLGTLEGNPFDGNPILNIEQYLAGDYTSAAINAAGLFWNGHRAVTSADSHGQTHSFQIDFNHETRAIEIWVDGGNASGGRPFVIFTQGS